VQFIYQTDSLQCIDAHCMVCYKMTGHLLLPSSVGPIQGLPRRDINHTHMQKSNLASNVINKYDTSPCRAEKAIAGSGEPLAYLTIHRHVNMP
jgi:hypothetical protein